MIDSTNTISEIATEVQNTANSVEEVYMMINATIEKIGGTTPNPLSGISEFVDNFATGKPEITPGMVGYSIDTDLNEYDVSVIGNSYIPFSGSGTAFGALGTNTTTHINNWIHILRDGRFFATSPNNYLTLQPRYGGGGLKQVLLKSSPYRSDKIEINNEEYIAISTIGEKEQYIFLYDSELDLVRYFDSSHCEIFHSQYYASSDLFFITSYGGAKKTVSIYNTNTGEFIKNIALNNLGVSIAFTFADEDYIYIVDGVADVNYYNRKTYEFVEKISTSTASLKTACYFGDKKMFILYTNSNGFVLDLVKKTLTSTRAYSSSSNTRVFSDGFTCVITYNNRFFK